jgi:hypothetical protein
MERNYDGRGTGQERIIDTHHFTNLNARLRE